MNASKPTLLLITQAPTHPLAHHALRFARSALQMGREVRVFFYANAATTANNLRWQSADQPNLTAEWQALATEYRLDLAVCVSTALARGVSDDDNAKRHHLATSNIAEGFRLVGLSELVMSIDSHQLLQF